MRVTIEDIQNLSLEVKALVDAGLPLESHLADAGAGHSQRLRELTESLSSSLQNGEPLEAVIRENRQGASRMLAAAVAAGLRSGQLGASIEMLGDMANDIVDLRRRILQSVTYPLTVLALALVLFFVFIRSFLARVRVLLDDVSLQPSPVLTGMLDLDAEYWWWPLLFPAAGVLCLLIWVMSGRAESMSFRGPERFLFVVPGIRGMVRDLQFYNLSRMLALLIHREIPLTEALLLAGACSGNADLDVACQRSAEQIEKGNLPALGKADNWEPGAIPPLLQTCLRQASRNEAEFRERLASVSGYYRRRLQISVSWLRNIVPVAMFIIVGGGSVVLYGLAVFWPVTEIYRFLAPGQG